MRTEPLPDYRRTPEFRYPFEVPVWFHMHGSKMRPEAIDLESKHLVIKASAAEVIIFPHPRRPQSWAIDYGIVHWASMSYSQGRVAMETEVLRAAFLGEDDPNNNQHGQAILYGFGGDAAEQGAYVRWGDFLSIPGPGTGHDGDPNVSIWVDEDIQAAVRELLGDN